MNNNELEIASIKEVAALLEESNIKYALKGNGAIHYQQNNFDVLRYTSDIDFEIDPNDFKVFEYLFAGNSVNNRGSSITVKLDGEFPKKIDIDGKYRENSINYSKIDGVVCYSMEAMLVEKLVLLSNVGDRRFKDCIDIYVILSHELDYNLINSILEYRFFEFGDFNDFLKKDIYLKGLNKQKRVVINVDIEMVYDTVFEAVVYVCNFISNLSIDGTEGFDEFHNGDI